jgi:hypothetical protein
VCTEPRYTGVKAPPCGVTILEINLPFISGPGSQSAKTLRLLGLCPSPHYRGTEVIKPHITTHYHSPILTQRSTLPP